MKETQGRMFQASEFARAAGVSVRTLHHYDRMGLLKPSRRKASGYRLYGEHDFARLQQIVTLKFIGLPLKQIKALLDTNSLDLTATLRLQREALSERRKQLDAALAAIDKVEQTGGTDWEALRKIIEVIEMENNMDWVKKYYTEEQLADLARRGTPEVLERGQGDWAALIREVEEAVAAKVDPATEHAQALAARWENLIEQFTGGDVGIRENLTKLYADQSNWPQTFKKPYSDEAANFISAAKSASKK